MLVAAPTPARTGRCQRMISSRSKCATLIALVKSSVPFDLVVYMPRVAHLGSHTCMYQPHTFCPLPISANNFTDPTMLRPTLGLLSYLFPPLLRPIARVLLPTHVCLRVVLLTRVCLLLLTHPFWLKQARTISPNTSHQAVSPTRGIELGFRV